MLPSRHKKLHLFWITPLVLIACCAGIGIVMLFRWVQSDECRALIEKKTTDQLHVKVKLTPLQLGWTSLSSESLRAIGSAETTLKSIESSGLRARLRLSALLQGSMVVEEISLARMVIHLGAVTGVKSVPVSTLPERADSLPNWLPLQFVVERIRSTSADVLIEQPNGGSINILGTSLESVPEGKQIRFDAHGGRLVSARFPDLSIAIDKRRCRLSGQGLDLTGADLSFHNGGALRLEGSFPSNESESRLKGHWEQVELVSLMPALTGKVLGTLEGNGEAAWDHDGMHALTGTISAHDVTLSDIPALEKLALFTGIDQFRHLPVQDAHATYAGGAEKTIWHDVVIESRGLLKLTGEAEVGKEGSLRGSFQVGITKGVVDIIPFAREILGLNEHDGYLWTPMILGGSLSHPKEDLSARLTTAVTAHAEGLLKEGIQEGMKVLGKAQGLLPSATNIPSTNDVKTLEQGAGKVFDTLGGFLK